MGRHFERMVTFWQMPTMGSAILPGRGERPDGTTSRVFLREENGAFLPLDGAERAPYLVLVASGGTLPALPAGLLQDRWYLARLLGTLKETSEESERRATALDAAKAELMSAGEELASKRDELGSARAELAETRGRASHLEEVVRQADRRHRDSELEVSALRGELDRRTLDLARAKGSIDRLDREVEELRKSLTEATRFTWSNLPGKIIGRARRYSPRKLLDLRRADVRKLWERRRLLRRIAASGAFDAEYYLEQNQDVAAAGWDPVLHYVLHGASEGRNPHPMFDTRYYLEQVPGLAASGENPLHHFLTRGLKEGRRPHPAYRADELLGVRVRQAPSLTPEPQRVPTPTERHESVPADRPVAPERPPDRFIARALTTSFRPRHARPPSISRLLVVSHVLPFPPRAGNEYRIHRMVKHLASRGYELVLVISPLPGAAPESGDLERATAEYANLLVVQRDGTILHSCESPDVLAVVEALASERPRQLAALAAPTMGAERLTTIERTFCPDHLVDLLTRLDSQLKPAAAICNYIFMSRFLPFLGDTTRKVIDTHDVFSTKKAKVVQFGIADELAITGFEEAALLSRAEVIIAIQPEEQQELQTMVPGREVLTTGVDFDRPAEVRPAPDEPVALLVASSNALNVAGARDLLTLAWPLIRRVSPQARLLVAGRICEALEGSWEGVELLGYAEDLDALYARARVVVNPAVAGTGLKIKTLEALAHLRPAVVWPSGTDGLSPALRRFCHIASNWYEFAEKVAAILTGPAPASLLQAREEIWRELSPEVVYAPLEHSLLGEPRAQRPRRAQPG